MGPWAHGGSGREGVGERVFPDARMPGGYQAARWFEYHLKGVDNGVMKQPAVAYYVMGDTSDPKAPGNQWRYAADWPVPAKDTPYYFAKGGGLARAAPAAAEAVAEYTFDPADPCPTIGGKNLTILKGPCNQNRIETRKDVLLFTTEPLAEPVEVTGRVRAKVFLASSAADTDLSVRLCDVYPDGKSFEMAEGMLRARCRQSLEKPEPLVPGQVAEVTVDCWSTSIVFNTGHRIRAIVTSSNYPRFDLNPGTGKPWSDGGEKVRQTNRISCDAARPSCIVLPVVSAGVRRAHVFVSGRVQGVGFRDFTQDSARTLGVTGWVRNLDDGRVEAVLEGPADKVAALLELLRRGPPAAQVTNLQAADEPPVGDFNSFEVRR